MIQLINAIFNKTDELLNGLGFLEIKREWKLTVIE